MNRYFVIIILFAVVGAIAAMRKMANTANPKKTKEREDFVDKITPRLEEGETILASCGNQPCCAITNEKVYIEDNGSIPDIRFSRITKVKTEDVTGGKCKKTQDIFIMTVYVANGKKYKIINESEGFEAFAEELLKRVDQ